MAKTMIIGNWKMNKTLTEAKVLFGAILENMPKTGDSQVQVVLCPPSINLAYACEVAGESDIAIGAQNIYWAKTGAFTGEISAPMIADIGCEYCILGHSERRMLFGESSNDVAKKVNAVTEVGLTPVICVGEDEEHRKALTYLDFIRIQLENSLSLWDKKSPIVVAYEPIWAIGTGLTASADDAEEVCAYIRQILAEICDIADDISILYGGSANAGNICKLLAMPNIDGGLIGGASLKADEFIEMITKAIALEEK